MKGAEGRMKKEWIVLVLMLCATLIAVSQAAAHAEGALPEVPEYSFQTEQTSFSDSEAALKYAQELCGADYFQNGDLTKAYWSIAEMEYGSYTAEAEQDGTMLSLLIGPDGSLRRYDNGFSHWTEAEEVFTYDGRNEAEETRREQIDLRIIEPFVRTFNPAAMDACLRDVTVNYDSKIFFTGYHGTFEKDQNQFLWFYTDAYQDRSIRMKFVVQTAPVMRVVYFDAELEATAEGGNG